jgi:adenylosuccinate synthase
MRNLAVIGAQWGDEGKGKIVDLLCESFDVVARYQGGHNAGHTVKFGAKHYSLRLIPSGILHADKLCILGNGMVIDPEALLDEIEQLRGLGVTIEQNLKISDSAHVILPYHKALDLAREEAAGASKIGTTGRGIGPTCSATGSSSRARRRIRCCATSTEKKASIRRSCTTTTRATARCWPIASRAARC